MRNPEIVEIDLYRKEFKNMSDEGETLASNFILFSITALVRLNTYYTITKYYYSNNWF